jgi:hypothetical protein
MPWVPTVAQRTPPPRRHIALLGATAGMVASLHVAPAPPGADEDEGGGHRSGSASATLTVLQLVRPCRDVAWRPGPRGPPSSTPLHRCRSGPGNHELAALHMIITLRLYDAAEDPEALPLMDDDDDEGAAAAAAAADDGARRGALEAVLLARAAAIEATPLAHALRGDDDEGGGGGGGGGGATATARLHAVVLPPGADAAGGDGDVALRWAAPPPDAEAQS